MSIWQCIIIMGPLHGMRVSLNSEVFFFDIHCFLKIHGNDQKLNGS